MLQHARWSSVATGDRVFQHYRPMNHHYIFFLNGNPTLGPQNCCCSDRVIMKVSECIQIVIQMKIG
uniref:Uncharacterized protein n=1 Tax=uncultured marine thaumarchaeote KM3_52_B01 TaxID=1456176 RepID=A0A075HCE5_9ARCH|nr:hypothetical protein [uncultured marine thaumarchaeote KM3_52_B01]